MRHLVRLMFAALGPDAAALPEVARCLSNLKDAVNEDLLVWKRRQRGKGRLVGEELEKLAKRLRSRLDSARSRYKKAEALRALQRAREEDGAHRISSEIVAKVALSAPSASSRAFADAWADPIALVPLGAADAPLDACAVHSVKS